MRAALLEEQGKPLSVIDDLVVADPGPGQVRVAVKHCGICHSDLGLIDAENPMPRLPVVLGHEAAGVVERVGAGVVGLARCITTDAPSSRARWRVAEKWSACVWVSIRYRIASPRAAAVAAKRSARSRFGSTIAATRSSSQPTRYERQPSVANSSKITALF